MQNGMPALIWRSPLCLLFTRRCFYRTSSLSPQPQPRIEASQSFRQFLLLMMSSMLFEFSLILGEMQCFLRFWWMRLYFRGLVTSTRSPVTRWVSVAFGAGVGVGSAYTKCSQKFDKAPLKFTTGISDTPPAKAGDE